MSESNRYAYIDFVKKHYNPEKEDWVDAMKRCKELYYKKKNNNNLSEKNITRLCHFLVELRKMSNIIIIGDLIESFRINDLDIRILDILFDNKFINYYPENQTIEWICKVDINTKMSVKILEEAFKIQNSRFKIFPKNATLNGNKIIGKEWNPFEYKVGSQYFKISNDNNFEEIDPIKDPFIEFTKTPDGHLTNKSMDNNEKELESQFKKNKNQNRPKTKTYNFYEKYPVIMDPNGFFEDESRNATISFKTTTDEKAIIDRLSEENNVSRSKFIADILSEFKHDYKLIGVEMKSKERHSLDVENQSLKEKVDNLKKENLNLKSKIFKLKKRIKTKIYSLKIFGLNIMETKKSQ